jgi:trehalose/maltose hydrolase-like predicted phosphorylase
LTIAARKPILPPAAGLFAKTFVGGYSMTISRRSFMKDSGVLLGLLPGVRNLTSTVPRDSSSGQGTPGAMAPGAIPRIVVEDFSKNFQPAYLSNGLIGIRPGPNPLAPAKTMVNGFVYSDIPFRVISLSPAPYPLVTDFRVRDVNLLNHPELVKVERQTLDMTNGELVTEMVFTPASGVTLRLQILQFACRAMPSLLCQEVTFSLSSDAQVEVVTAIDAEDFSGSIYSARPPEGTQVELAVGYLSQGGDSKLGVSVAIPVSSEFKRLGEQVTGRATPATGFRLDAKGGQTYRFPSVAAMVSDFYQPSPEQEAIRQAKQGATLGVDFLRLQNQSQWSELWKSRVKVFGDAESQRVLDSAFFYLHASLHPSNLNGMAPFGLSQFDYYYGHSFWDTESWSLLPAALASPAAARSLLEFRVRGLTNARRLAALYGLRGAQFPWEASPIDGADVTPTFAGTGWQEQHVTPDVALGFWEYHVLTGDENFLREGAWPVLRAVAEWIESRGTQTDRGFEIQHMMGPDEGVPDTNNNAYMNLISKMVLAAAIRCSELVGMKAPAAWSKAHDAMVIPMDSARKVILPYDGATPGKSYSLGSVDLLAVHDPPVSLDLLRRTHGYEDGLRGSEWAGIGFAVAASAATAALLGDRAEARRLFDQAWKNVWIEPYGMIREAPSEDYGCFLTNFGSLLQTALMGFTGLRIREGNWQAYPAHLPQGWSRIEVDQLWVRGNPQRLIAEDGKPAQLLD